MRTPTEKQHRLLLNLGNGAAWISANKRECEPLLQHGWVTTTHPAPGFVRITPEGLRALAASVERYGLPDLTGAKRYERICSECERPWKPRCKCGCGSWRYRVEELVVA